ncbi:MAG: type II toxin-antitoxin system RelE/ParE family toxin [Cyanobacteria bacterium J06621_8]
MALYEIEWKRSAKKELRKLDKLVIIRILQAVESLAEDPLQPGSKTLAGSNSIYRIRVGNYRVIYNIESSVLTIEIIKVVHRGQVYRKK